MYVENQNHHLFIYFLTMRLQWIEKRDSGGGEACKGVRQQARPEQRWLKITATFSRRVRSFGMPNRY